MEINQNSVTIKEETILIPTYGVGEPEKNPLFLEKRVYQGSTGRVYPYPVIDKIEDEKFDKAYKAIILENAYLRVVVLPELGGRIQRATDKTNNYDFVYYNEVIKPALVGLCGPWISGGIEFNWPQHHRPTTFSPVNYTITTHKNGSKSVSLHEIDQMYGTKGTACFTLYPDKAYIEITGQVYNPTPLDQTFLWWANPAIPVNDQTQSIFPPDVHAVMDHGKRAVSRFPIATGEYYKYDYSPGVDISKYKNIAVPTSYMAHHSDFDFIGGYDYGLAAGILHVADHHISPGKKQWTWGCGDFGQAWDRNLTDDNGPYVELMTGVFTDNQPDFAWLKPFEEKSFTQYFMPYKKLGAVKNASCDVVLNLEIENQEAMVQVYTTGEKKVKIVLATKEKTFLDTSVTLSPTHLFEEKITLPPVDPHKVTLSVYDIDNRLLLSYRPLEKKIEKAPAPAQAAKLPQELFTNEEMFLTGLHIEQYRHATYEPDPYYLEGLKRDPGDSRINIAYGMLLLRRGAFTKSEPYFRAAIERLTWKSPNPYSGEAHYGLGLSLFYQGQRTTAFDAFYKATWNHAQQEMAFYYLAAIEAQQKNYPAALSFIEKALIKNTHNIKGRGLKMALLHKLGRLEEVIAFGEESLTIDPFDHLSHHELVTLGHRRVEDLQKIMGGHVSTYITIATHYSEAGFFEQAIALLNQSNAQSNPMVHYYLAWNKAQLGNISAAQEALATAAAAPADYCFPNKLEDMAILTLAMAQNPKDGKAPYYLGCLLYDKRRYHEAIEMWEKSAHIEDTFPTVWRNLAQGYYNKTKDVPRAQAALEKAFALNTSDARVFLELDQLHKKLGYSPNKRLAAFEKHKALWLKRDDLYSEYVTLLNLLGRHQEALTLMLTRQFHPWEGGEGKITSQYAIALKELAQKDILAENYAAAEDKLRRALVFPHNLGEGKLAGAKDNDIYFWLGILYEKMENHTQAAACFEKAAPGDEEPAGAMYYYDQPADMILYQGLANRFLGREDKARSRFYKLINYGEDHIFDDVAIDYFAVSLPELQIFEEDLNIRNQIHCHYLMGLGYLGLKNTEKALAQFQQVLTLDPSHQGALLHQNLLSTNFEEGF